MKKVFILILSVLSFAAYAADLTSDSLNGKWKIIPKSAEEASMGEDHWVFSNGKIQVYSSGKKMGMADPYRVENSKIIYGTKPWEVTIEVTSFTGNEMTVITSGITQNLKKEQ